MSIKIKKNIGNLKYGFKRRQILEFGCLNYHSLNLRYMLIQEYKQVLSLADHGCGYPKGLDVLKSYLLFQNHQ